MWRACLDDDMPRHLITAFTIALASDEPAQRGMYDVPHSHLVTQHQRGPQGEQLAAARKARLKAVRAAVRSARRSAALPTCNGPALAAASPATVRSR
ncbi:DUF317 domain-containing protein [Streptomyces sp. NPDC054813]